MQGVFSLLPMQPPRTLLYEPFGEIVLSVLDSAENR